MIHVAPKDLNVLFFLFFFYEPFPIANEDVVVVPRFVFPDSFKLHF